MIEIDSKIYTARVQAECEESCEELRSVLLYECRILVHYNIGSTVIVQDLQPLILTGHVVPSSSAEAKLLYPHYDLHCDPPTVLVTPTVPERRYSIFLKVPRRTRLDFQTGCTVLVHCNRECLALRPDDRRPTPPSFEPAACQLARTRLSAQYRILVHHTSAVRVLSLL